MIRKFTKYILFLWILIWFFWLCHATKYGWSEWILSATNPYASNPTNNLNCVENTDLWNCTSTRQDDDTIIVRLLEVFWLENSTDRDKDLKFIDYAKAIVNMALWLIAFIALIMSIYTFYLMFFTDNEAWIKKAKWNLLGIFIALAIIGLAWLIVSFIFRWYQSNRKDNENYIGSNNVAMLDNTCENNQIYLHI